MTEMYPTKWKLTAINQGYEMIKFTIPGSPVSSKNSIRSAMTKDGRNYTYTTKRVKEYKDSALLWLKKQIYKVSLSLIRNPESKGTC